MTTFDDISISFHCSLKTLKNYNILYININSLLNKIDDLETCIEALSRNGKTIHFIALTEVRLDDDTSNFFGITNYTAFFCNKIKNSGGVALYCHESLSCSLVLKQSMLNVDLLCVHITSLNIKIAVIYKQPPVPNSILLPILDSLLDKYENCFVIGDLNIDLLSNNTDKHALLNTCQINGYTCLNKLSTEMATRSAIRDGRCSNTIIDHAITDLLHFDYDFCVVDSTLSDHKLILISFDMPSNRPPAQNNSIKYNINTVQYSKFRNTILSIPLLRKNDLNTTDIDDCLSILSSSLKNSTISKPMHVTNNNKPWITNDLLNLVDERNLYFKLHKKYPHNDFVSMTYKKLKSTVDKKRKRLKNDYFSKLITKNSKNLRKLWVIFNQIIYNKSKTFPTIDSITRNDGICTTDQSEISNELCTHFTSVGAILATKIQNEQPPQRMACTLNRSTLHSMMVPNFEHHDILNALNSINSNSSTDDINTSLLRNNSDIFVPLLTNIVNDSFKNGYFPDALKLAKIVPLFKAGDRTIPQNYRPISILPIISKIFEKLLYSITDKFLKKNNTIDKLQFGFQKTSGCLSAASHLIDQLQTALDDPKQKLAAGLFIDLQKAFDSIPHDNILNKLYKYGIRGIALDIFKSYLQNRRQYVHLNGVNSEQLTITFGIPQGSVLGPLIFLLYINDIFDIPFRGKIQLFADDAAFVYTNCNEYRLFDDMQHDLNLLSNWLYHNLLSLNVEKTNYIIFHSPHKTVNTANFSLSVNNKTITEVTSTKYLGLHIHSSLKWNTHIDSIIKNISPLIGILRRLNHNTPNYLLRNIYYAHIHSRLTYLCQIWGPPSPAYKLSELQILQNKALRNLFAREYVSDGLSTADLFLKHNILNMNQILQSECASYFYKLIHKLVKSNHIIKYNSEFHSHDTRHNSNIRIPRLHTNYGLFNVFSYSSLLYNRTPANIKQQPSLFLFKKHLRQHLLSLTGPSSV